MVWGRAVLGAAVVAMLPLAPALADSTVVVHGTAFPSGRAAQLSFVGCDDPYLRAPEQPQPYVGIGPDQAPAGTRSLGYDAAGGNAVGSVHYVDSMLRTTVAGMSVHAPDGASGVTYAGYQEPADWGTGKVWFGRAALSAPAGGWTRVDAAGLAFTWTKYDMLTQRRLDQTAPASRIPAFVKAHGGDGPGFFTIGFGCDGRAFSMDAWRIGGPGGVTTYDLEGLTTTTSISGPNGVIDPGQEVTLHGAVVDNTGAPLPGARLVLEAQGENGAWTLVEGAGGADPALTVAPEATTTYRWRFVDRPLAEGSASAPFTVEVRKAEQAPEQTRKQAREQTRQQAREQTRKQAREQAPERAPERARRHR
ncbi:hypothetical protein [Nocardioides caricicola]|uniref:Uncharacterized protein n=1 Tax=Nocardioides caricicola TaxID=634770 RepID=A0ABW0N4A4_9ACTN